MKNELKILRREEGKEKCYDTTEMKKAKILVNMNRKNHFYIKDKTQKEFVISYFFFLLMPLFV